MSQILHNRHARHRRLHPEDYALGRAELSLDWVDAIARQGRAVKISDDDSVRRRVSRAVEVLEAALQRNEPIYGVNTGFGGMAERSVGCDWASQLQGNLLQFLNVSVGEPLAAVHTRAAMLLRAHVLLQGKSGIRLELIERLVRFLNAGFTPVVREQGSIGASGDLVPLACIARAITGQGPAEVVRDGQRIAAADALGELGLAPISLRPKEGLALVNGTSFSAAIAVNATCRAQRLLAMSITVQAMMMRALLVQESPFAEFVHQAKPHPGQVWVAETLRSLLTEGSRTIGVASEQVQDRYSLRCMPQYTGSLVESLARIQRTVEVEMNSVSDNPLIDTEAEVFHQSGNFLGQYVGVAMDDLRRVLGLLAKHLDVQIATLVAPEFNGGLPASLVGNPDLPINMGLKGLQICGNSIVPMLTHAANPLVEHYPTHAEQFNQNINGLSWGAANLAWKSVASYEQYCAIALVFAVQSLDLRARQVEGHYDGRVLLGTVSSAVYDAVLAVTDTSASEQRPFLWDDGDRNLQADVDRLTRSLTQESELRHAIQPVFDSFRQRLGEFR